MKDWDVYGRSGALDAGGRFRGVHQLFEQSFHRNTSPASLIDEAAFEIEPLLEWANRDGIEE